MRIDRLTLTVADVTSKTCWTFVEVASSEGLVGTGEASLLGRETVLIAAFDALAAAFVGQASDPAVTMAGPIPDDIASAAIWSAIDQALHDIEAQRQARPLADVLGRQRRDIAVYANINRRTVERTPAAFAASAEAAYERGFRALKMAPFDEVRPQTASLATAAAGLARIRAVRARLPADCAVYVDCHWRFTPAVAIDMVAALADAGVAWYECPIAETDDAGPTLADLRQRANQRGMVLAGREEGVTRRPFAHYADAGAYDVMMPDVKYIGGIAEMLATAHLLYGRGIGFSPHNHTGPIGHVASLAVALAAEGADILEMQFDETRHFEGLVQGDLPQPIDGRLTASMQPGLGIRLDSEALRRLTSVRREVGSTLG